MSHKAWVCVDAISICELMKSTSNLSGVCIRTKKKDFILKAKIHDLRYDIINFDG